MHKVILINSASNRTEHEFETIEEANGSCGPKTPLIFDGHAGYFEFVSVDSNKVRFIETDPVFQYFKFAHLPEKLQAVSRRFYELAEWMIFNLPRNPERTFALRELMLSKDAAVRTAITP